MLLKGDVFYCIEMGTNTSIQQHGQLLVLYPAAAAARSPVAA